MATISKVSVWNRALSRIHQTQQIQSVEENTPAAKACVLHYDDVLEEVLRAYPWRWAMREKILTSIGTQSYTYTYAALVNPYDTFPVTYPFVNTSQVVVTHIDGAAVETVLTAVDDYTFNDTDPKTITLDTALIAGESVKVTVTTSREGWDYIYAMPDDCVRAVALLPDGGRYSQMSVESRLEFEIMVSDDGNSLVLVTNESSSTFAALSYVARIVNVGVMPRDFVDALIWRLASELAEGLAKDVKRAMHCRQMYELVLGAAADVNESEGHASWQTPPGLAAR